MENDFSKRRYIKVITFLSIVSVLLCAATVVNAVRVDRYRRMSASANERAVSELCEDLDSITVSLQKGIYSNSKVMLSQVGTELYRNSACAKVNLGQLTDEEMITDEIYKFLSQVGDFTLYLDRKLESGTTLTTKDRDSLKKLYDYSAALSKGLGSIRDGYYDGSVSFEKRLSTLTLDSDEEASLFSDSVNDAQQSLTDYPTLVYDGPFADSMLNREGVFLKGEKEISQNEAKKIAAKILAVNESKLRQDSDENSSISFYCFSTGERSISITKKGGWLGYMTNPDYSGKAVITEKDAMKRGKDFLEKLGFKGMESSYYSTYDGVCTVNYAYKSGGIIYYADLIKVSVALDTGNVVAADARGYLTNHCKRELAAPKVTLNKAKNSISEQLSITSTAVAVIPTKYSEEKLCYEIHCRDKSGQEALIYIDALTGQEADILLLLYSDSGVLTR